MLCANNDDCIDPNCQSSFYLNVVKKFAVIHDRANLIIGKENLLDIIKARFLIANNIEEYAKKAGSLAKYDDWDSSGVYFDNAMITKNHHQLWFLNKSYKLYQSWFDNFQQEVLNFFEFGNKFMKNLKIGYDVKKNSNFSKLTVDEISKMLCFSKKFYLYSIYFYHISKWYQDVWVLKNKPYAIRIKENEITLSLLKKHPYNPNKDKAINEIFDGKHLVCDKENEMVKFGFYGGFSYLIPGTRYEKAGSFKDSDTRWYKHDHEAQDLTHYY
jgi:hypothetical protein